MTKVFIRTPQDIGALLRSRRRALGTSQADLASKLGTSRLWITEIERGKPRASLGLILQAISALGLELATDDEGKGAKDAAAKSNDALTRELHRRAT
jgi:HTH-type transcriptional regulator / antitoxin HipB